jgi:hypothetical protein
MIVLLALGAYRALWSRHPSEPPAPGITLEAQLMNPFHRRLASRVWLTRLAAHVEQAIGGIPEFQTAEGHGILRSKHDAERYMGDSSLVRYYFAVDVLVQRRDSATEHDRYTAQVKYLPHRDWIQIHDEVVETCEMRTRQAEEEAARRRGEAANFEQLRAALNGREAIFIAKGVLRVRVSGIQYDPERRRGGTTIEEIPTAGLGRTMFHRRRPDRTVPLTWGIAGGYLPAFTDDEWTMGCDGWSLYFAPSIVAGVVDMARQWPEDITPLEQHRRALAFVLEQSCKRDGPMQRVFREQKRSGVRGGS